MFAVGLRTEPPSSSAPSSRMMGKGVIANAILSPDDGGCQCQVEEVVSKRTMLPPQNVPIENVDFKPVDATSKTRIDDALEDLEKMKVDPLNLTKSKVLIAVNKLLQCGVGSICISTLTAL